MPDIALYIKQISIFLVPLLLALTCHEAAHGYVAYLLGDPTAKLAGRLTLNPIKHLDPIGTLVFLVTRMIGWAKPVPVNPRYFKDPQKGMLYVALAGPGANFVLAVFFALIFHLLNGMSISGPDSPMLKFLEPAVTIAYAGVFVNLALGIFNLTPIPPLDGSNIVAGLLPRDLAVKYMSVGRYGIIIILGLAFLGVFEKVVFPLIGWGMALLRMPML